MHLQLRVVRKGRQDSHSVCPRAHEGQVKVQYHCGSEVSYKRNASTIAECTYAGTQKVSMPIC